MELENHISKDFIKNGLISLPEHINKIKIDVGLSISAPISWNWLETDSKVAVFGFEPNLKNIEEIKGNALDNSQDTLSLFQHNNFSKYLGKRFFIIPYALSQENSEKEFYNVVTKLNQSKSGYEFESGSSSLLKPISMEYVKSKVKVYNLFTFLSKFDWKKITSITQIKIDAQGEDFKIIYGLKNFIKKVEVISYEINAPGYYKYNNYKLQNIKLFFYMVTNGFYPLKKTASEITYKNIRYVKSKDNYYTSGH